MRIIYLLLFIALSLGAAAQRNGIIRGLAFDTISKQPVSGATITLMEKKDSSLVSFTMTGDDGRFELKGIPNGSYRLLITHVNYHSSNNFFTVSDSLKSIDLRNIVMNDRSKVLEEVVLDGEAPPITMINDTIQYNAGSFKVQPNANVEQLLKKLPGVKVEKDGTIKAQGEKVTRVLVDGKEFFGDDPKMATKNLPADAIDKVQVYDKQSDQAQLTGFEDGNYEKTINLKLKKDKKKGVFGKVNAGLGDKERFEGKFNVNSFKGARQLSAIGMGNNTNAEGFSFMDILNFTGELARMQRSGGGGMNISMTADDAAAMGINAGGRNSGITTAWGGGLNYNNIIGTKTDFQGNYFYSRFRPRRESHIQREFIGVPLKYNEDAYSNNLSSSHRLNANALYQQDSSSSIRIIPSFSMQDVKNISTRNYQTYSNDILTNEGMSKTTAENSGFNFRNEIGWRKKFKRRGRTFSLNLQTTLNESDGEGTLSSINNIYQPNGTLLRRDTINQQNTTRARLKGYTARAVYTEPLGKRWLMELSGSKSYTRSVSEKVTYDYNKSNEKYDRINDALTNNFENEFGYSNVGLRFRTQKKKYNYSFGVNWQQAELQGTITNGVKDSVISKSFSDILPNARLQYNFTKYKNLTVSYNTNTTQPTAAQLQPVPDNSNVLNIREGNPDLQQEFNHMVQTKLTMFSPYKNKNFFMFLTLRATENKIVNYDSVNLQTGVRKTKPMNADGVYNLNGSLNYSLPLKFLKANIEFGFIGGYNRDKQFLNGSAGQIQANSIKTVTLGPEVRLDINALQKINFNVSAGLNYNRTRYSLQGSLDATYLSQDYSVSMDWELPKGLFFSTDFNYSVNSQRASGFNLKVPLWNASISKQVLKNNRGELKISGRDLLDKNIGITRNTGNNYVEDSRVLTLRRFFLVSFTYNLTKTGLSNASGGPVIRVRR